MHKTFWQILITLTFLLVACGQSTPALQATPQPDQPTTTSSPPPTATPTRTALPSPTPTATITPLPTIPTFTPTFDASKIVTVTPAPKAECPQPDNPSQVDFAIYPSGQKYADHPTIATILDFLNSGGQMEQLDSELRQIDALYSIKDITNDGIPDLIVVSGSAYQTANILWCQNGRYNLFPNDIVEAETLGSDNVKFEMRDLNQNSIPEVLSIGDGKVGLNVNLLEWNGETFIDLTTSETQINANMINASKDDFELRDINKDGISELILKGYPNSWYYPGEPLRNQTDTYHWNDKNYSSSTSFSSPQYRFQAIQDADQKTANGEYEKAIQLYQEVIFNNKLDWWSPERREFLLTFLHNPNTPSPSQINKLSGLTEYPRLAAYAYYRIMLLHLVKENELDAIVIYDILQEKFGDDPYGFPYVEMASAFWDAYQSTHKMYDGCAAAIQYAAVHPEILTPLGSDYHGSQSHQYKPEDVCPFR